MIEPERSFAYHLQMKAVGSDLYVCHPSYSSNSLLALVLSSHRGKRRQSRFHPNGAQMDRRCHRTQRLLPIGQRLERQCNPRAQEASQTPRGHLLDRDQLIRSTHFHDETAAQTHCSCSRSRPPRQRPTATSRCIGCCRPPSVRRRERRMPSLPQPC